MKNKQSKTNDQAPVTRVRTPRGNEVLGVVEQRSGGIRMVVRCFDGKTRNCRVPGRLQRALWLRERDVVLVQPWEFENEKGDVIFKYYPNQVEWLKRNGFLKEIEDI